MPQIYYVGLLAGENDDVAVERTGDGRAINRHNFTMDEIDDALRRPVVQRIVDLIRLRNVHPAFDGELCVESADGRSISMRWTNDDRHLDLDVDFEDGRACLSDGGDAREIASWVP